MRAAMRHLVRNRRRSLLTLLAVLIPVYVLVIMFGFASANLSDLFDTATSLDTGHLQIRQVETQATGSATPLIQDPSPILAALDEVHGVEWSTVRLDLPALASVGDRSRTVLVQGVIPEQLAPTSPMPGLIVSGSYLTSDSSGIVIGQELAGLLKVGVGQDVILLGAHPETGVGVLRVPVVGIYDAPIAEMGRTMVQAPLALARQLARNPTAATAVVVRVAGVTGPWDTGKIDAVAAQLRALLPAQFEVVDWRTLAPQVEVYMRILNPALFIIAAVFFGLGALVVLNTIYLSVLERTRELGLVLSLGATHWRVMRMVLSEAAVIAVVGSISGALAGVTLIWVIQAFGGIPLPTSFAAFAKAVGINSVLNLRVAVPQVLQSAAAMALVAILAAWYPALRASKLEPVEAMRYVE